MGDAVLSLNVVVYSLQTLIYRCIPPPQPAHPLQFCEECVSAARIALKQLVVAWQQIKLQDDQAGRMFINWTLLFVPFVPFIVIFGNVIAQRDRNDLVLLEQVEETMQAASKVTSAIEKLKVACERFCLIAQSYLSQQEGQPAADTNVRARGQLLNMDNSTGANQNVDHNIPGAPLSAGAGAFDSLPDFPWDGMLSEWDLGLGAESAREMGAFFGQYTSTGGGFPQTNPSNVGYGFN